jgi:hypothetical protein
MKPERLTNQKIGAAGIFCFLPDRWRVRYALETRAAGPK